MNKKLRIAIAIVFALIILSLCAIVFISATTATIKKPAVYLYPETDRFVNVSLDINGEIIASVPNYNNGWDVFVTKDGIIDRKYDYLFYEASLKNIELPKEGWVVKYNDIEEWFDNNLILLGLNEKEKNQFKEYWLNEIPESNFYLIKILDKEFLNENMNLIINPHPNTKIRLNFYFKPLKNKIKINNPEIITPKRLGFTIVEWGGILENKKSFN